MSKKKRKELGKDYIPRSPKEVKELVKKLSKKTNDPITSVNNLKNLERR